MIFVFGSNLAGRHGRGAALHAIKHEGAIYGKGVGRQGNSYAIPTKGHDLETLPLAHIQECVYGFICYASEYDGEEFNVTAIGTGLAGYRHEDIAPMFQAIPPNVQLPEVWANLVYPV